MRQEEAAFLDAINFADLLKERFPFLRRDTLQRVQDAFCALIEQRTTNQQQWSQAMPGTGSPEAKKKRLGRCIQDPQLDRNFFLSFLISLLPAGKLVLSLDRTNWEHGDTPLNLLVLGVVLEGFTLPLVWVALDHGGCSDSATRERLVARLLESLPALCWKALVADREFVGKQWFTFLRKRKIRRVIRIRADSVVDELRVDQWFGDVQIGKKRCLFEKGWVYGCVMQVVATRASVPDSFCSYGLVRHPELNQIKQFISRSPDLTGRCPDERPEAQGHNTPCAPSVFFEGYMLVDADQDAPDIGQG